MPTTFNEDGFQRIVGIHFPARFKYLLIVEGQTAAWNPFGFAGAAPDLRIDTVSLTGPGTLFVPGVFAGAAGPVSIQSTPVSGPPIDHGGLNMNDQTIQVTAAMLAAGAYQQIEYDQRNDLNIHTDAAYNQLNTMIFNLTELKRLGNSVLSLAGSYDQHGNTGHGTNFEVDLQIVKLAAADLPFDAWTFATGTVLESHTLALATPFGGSTSWSCDVNLTSKTITSLVGAAWT